MSSANRHTGVLSNALGNNDLTDLDTWFVNPFGEDLELGSISAAADSAKPNTFNAADSGVFDFLYTSSDSSQSNTTNTVNETLSALAQDILEIENPFKLPSGQTIGYYTKPIPCDMDATYRASDDLSATRTARVSRALLTRLIRKEALQLVGAKKVPAMVVTKDGMTRSFVKSILPEGSANSAEINNTFYKPNYSVSPKHPANAEFIRVLLEATLDATVREHLIVTKELVEKAVLAYFRTMRGNYKKQVQASWKGKENQLDANKTMKRGNIRKN